jgi:hypothetical protein
MAQLKIPLNKFRSKFVTLSAGAGITQIYSTPENRATIVIAAQVTNITTSDRTVSVGISSTGTVDNPVPGVYYLVKDFPIPANDARSVISGRIVLQGADNDQIINSEVLFAEDDTILSPTATFSGRIEITDQDGTVLTVSEVTQGPILAGMELTSTGTISAGTTITGLSAGTTGDVGKYFINIPQTTASIPFVGFIPTMPRDTQGLILNLGLLETINTN